MAYIDYLPEDRIPPEDRVPDQDHILQIHGVHSQVMKLHFDLYRELMYGKSPLSRIQRERLALAVSARNRCVY